MINLDNREVAYGRNPSKKKNNNNNNNNKNYAVSDHV